jgi:pimeloyl-ACP methyl ester carboxylesterase
MNSSVINTKIGEIEYCSVGQGIPIVFIHGGHSNCFDTLSHKGFDLSKFQLITPSRPGYGKTPLNGHTHAQTSCRINRRITELPSHHVAFPKNRTA